MADDIPKANPKPIPKPGSLKPAGSGKKDRKDYKSLTGRQKAAIFLVSLGSDVSSEIMKHLREDEVETLTFEIARLETVDAEYKDAVLEEFQELNKLRKGLKKLGNYNIRQLGRETSVLEETAKYAHAKRLWAFPPELLSNAKYSQYHEKDGARNFLKGLSKNPDAVASVLSVWLKEE